MQKKVNYFSAGLANRKDEVKQRCRTVLQLSAEGRLRDARLDSRYLANAHLTLALV